MRDGSLLRRPRRATVRAAAGPVLDVAIGSAIGLAVLLTAIWLSSRTSEDFSDAFTGRMAFRGVGDKTIEIAGAVLAIVLGAAAHEASRWVRGRLAARRERRSGEPQPASAAEPTAPTGPTAGQTTATAWVLLMLAVVFLVATTLLAAGATTVLGALGVIPPRGAAPLASAVTVGAAAALAVRHVPGVRAQARGAVVVCQGFFAGGAFVLLPPPVLTADGASLLVRSWAGPLGWVLAGALAVLVAAASVRTARRPTADDGARPSAVVAPAVVVGAVALTAAVPVPFVPFVPDDGYHFGEFVTPPFLLADFGQVPFVDQVPARGILVNYVPAWIAAALTEPWAGLLPVGFAVLALPILAATFWLVRDLAGPGWAAAITVGAGLASTSRVAVNDLAMVVLLLALDRAARAWRLWAVAAAFAGSVVLAVLLAPAQGLAYAVAGGALLALRTVQRPPIRQEWALAAVAIAGVVVAAFPLWAALRGAAEYVLEQGAVNDQVWGIPWADSLDMTTPVTTLKSGSRDVLERGAALPGIGVILVLCVRSARRFRASPALPLWLGLGAYIALQLPRALGRIDPGVYSRIGALTLVVMGVVVPVTLLSQRRPPPAWAVATLVVAALAPSALGVTETAGAPPLREPVALVSDRAMAITPDPGLSAVSTEPGAAALSRALVADSLLDHASTQATQLGALLPPGSPRELLDLTNYQAYFRYLEVDNPLTTAAAFNITSEGVELKNLRHLTERPPAVALLWHESADDHDGGGLALRTPLLYEWVLETYTPLVCGRPGEPGYAIWGVRDGAEPEGCTLARTEWERTDLFAQSIGATPALLALPRAWGAPRSQVMSVLTATEEVTTTTQPTATGITVDVPLPQQNLRSAILALDLECGGWTDGTITWVETSTSPAGSATATIGGGRVLLPLGSYPSLALAEGLDSVRIDIPGAQDCTIGTSTGWLTRDRITRAVDLGLLTTAPGRVLSSDAPAERETTEEDQP